MKTIMQNYKYHGSANYQIEDLKKQSAFIFHCSMQTQCYSSNKFLQVDGTTLQSNNNNIKLL